MALHVRITSITLQAIHTCRTFQCHHLQAWWTCFGSWRNCCNKTNIIYHICPIYPLLQHTTINFSNRMQPHVHNMYKYILSILLLQLYMCINKLDSRLPIFTVLEDYLVSSQPCLSLMSLLVMPFKSVCSSVRGRQSINNFTVISSSVRGRGSVNNFTTKIWCSSQQTNNLTKPPASILPLCCHTDSTLTSARTAGQHQNTMWCMIMWGLSSVRISSLHNCTHPPKMEINPLRMSNGYPVSQFGLAVRR